MALTVGIIGSGTVAQTLGKGFFGAGASVTMGTRDPGKLATFTAETGIPVADVATAAAADVLVLAVKGTAAETVVRQLGSALAGKVVIDTTNPIADGAPDAGVLRYFTNANESLMERLQAIAPGARFVKAWNSVGAPFMIHPTFAEGRPTMFICGNDADAKAQVAEILDGFGWRPKDVGLAPSARPVEALCQLWCAPGFLSGQWRHAFALFER
ncbi:MAG: NAD(P)-binding domain-containing protein [Myxococcales bacterium]|nr:NAD(P)-binding domain-containing protein [Myxococcales bacterium]